MKKNITKISLALLAFPLVASAQEFTVMQIIDYIADIVSRLTVIAGGVALLAFLWGLAKFIFKVGGDAKIEEGKTLMKWGLIALFVMISVWGIIRFFQSELGIQNANSALPLPTLK